MQSTLFMLLTKKKRNNKNKIPGEFWSAWAQWQVPLLNSGFSECREARSLSCISEQETMKMTQHEQRNRWEMCYAKRLRGGRPVPGPSLKTNSRSRERHALSYNVLFIALMGIVFPWKMNRLPGSAAWSCVLASSSLCATMLMTYCLPSPDQPHYHQYSGFGDRVLRKARAEGWH